MFIHCNSCTVVEYKNRFESHDCYVDNAGHQSDWNAYLSGYIYGGGVMKLNLSICHPDIEPLGSRQG